MQSYNTLRVNGEKMKTKESLKLRKLKELKEMR